MTPTWLKKKRARRRERYITRARVCAASGKPAYETKVLARRAATEQRERADGKVLRPYRCRDCDAWHLTSQAAS